MMKHFKKGCFLLKTCSLLFLLCITIPTYAQEVIQVKGKVLDANTNDTLIGVSIVSKKDKSVGTITNMDGEFTLQVPKGTLLQCSYIGYESVEVAAGLNLVIKMSEFTEFLDEVVVIGYGTAKRKDVTTAISSVSTKDIDKRPLISAGQAIQGKAAGVSVSQPNGAPGGEMVIRVRGTTSFNGSNDPLYVVDGVPVDNLNFLSPNDIADIQILKDASSAAIYGSRAANGVVLVTTKKGQAGNAKIDFNAQLTMNRVSK